MIKEIKYGTTNTYLIKGKKGSILFDTGWAGTLAAFCHALGEAGEKVQDISYILISHYHPDHMGIAQEIADMGPEICAADIQRDYIHSSDSIFAKDKKSGFAPVKDENVVFFSLDDSREFLKKNGIDGCVYATPGHSDDSISLMLDSGELFVGDLNPLYELELHKGTKIEETWNMLLSRNPRKVYYGHARTAEFETSDSGSDTAINRIKNMEKIFDKANKLIDNAYEDMDALIDYQDEISKLEEYYTGNLWKEDFALDEAGMLPEDLKRGVLSEDGIYNLLERNRELLEEKYNG